MDNLGFRKSSYSGGSSNCVEIADTPAIHAVRDSKSPQQDPLTFPHEAWSRFLSDVKTGRL